MPAFLSIAAAYLLGSISSTWIVARIFGNHDMSKEPDGTISAASVYYKIGAFPYLLTVIMDIALGVLAVVLARAITHSLTIAMFAGLAAMAGHNWSLFLHFKGGQGATTMAGAIGAVMLLPLSCGLAAAGLVGLLTHRNGLGTAIGVLVIALVALIDGNTGTVAAYPLSLLSLMAIKRFQLSRAAGRDMINSPK
jgi:glycerol-3-phosphate acyltransferase PlsY